MTTKYTPTVIRVASSTSSTTSNKTSAPRRRPRCKNKIKHNESENRRRERLRAKFDELREVLGMEDPTDRCTLLDRAITTIRSYTKRKRSRQQMEEESSSKHETDDDLPLVHLHTTHTQSITSVKDEPQQQQQQQQEIARTTRVARQHKEKDKQPKLNFNNQVDIEIAHVNMHSIDESVVAAVTAAARSASASLSNSPTIAYRSTSPTSSITSSSSSHSPVSTKSPTPAPISSLVALAAAARQSPPPHQSSSAEKSHKRARLSTSSHDSDKFRHPLVHDSSISPKSMTSSSIPTALLALDGRIVDVDVSLCTLLGHDQVTLTTQTIFALIHPSELSTLFEVMKRMLANEIPSYDAIQRCIRRDGSILVVHLHMNMITQGDLSYFLCFLQPSNSPTLHSETVTPLVYSNSPSISSARNFLFPPLTRSTSPPPIIIPRSSTTGSSTPLSTSSSSSSLTNLSFPLFTRVRPPLPTSSVSLAPLLSRFPINFPTPIEN